MAERRLVVSELLCFLCYTFNKWQASLMRTSIVDFYSSIDISVAKDLILEEARRLKLENLPRRRRDSVDNKFRLDVDDIFAILSMLDERKLLDQIPIYVVKNVENVPLLKMEEGEFRILKNGMDTLANDLKKVNIDMLNKIGALGENVCAQFESHVKSVIQTMNVELDRKLKSLLFSTSAIPFRSSAQVAHSGSQVNKQNIINEVVNRFIDNNASMDSSSMDTSDVDNRVDSDNNADYVEFKGSRRKRRKRQQSKDVSPSQPDANRWTTGSGQMQYSQVVQKGQTTTVVQPRQPLRNRNFVGKRLTADGGQYQGLKASRSLLKKTFFHVSNVARAFSADNLVSYVSDNIKVNVISCFELIKKDEAGNPVTTWTAKNGKTYDTPKAFRVCINGDDSNKFLNMENWPEHVVVRCWTFKKRKMLGPKKS